MGRICFATEWAKRLSVRIATPKGRKKRWDKASPAAKPPSSSGAPTTWASQAKNKTRETMVVGISPGSRIS